MKKEVPKFGVKETIQFIGLKDLSPEEQDVVQTLTTEYYAKVKREVQNVTDFAVHIKTEGSKSIDHTTRKRFTVITRAIFPGFVIEAKEADEYELPKAVHAVFQEMLSQIKHRLKE